MRPEEEEIEVLSRAILKEADVDAEQIKEEAKAKADAIRQRAQAEAEQERKQILDQARQEAERLRSQVVANAQLKARTLQLEHREKLLDRVFEAAKQKLPAIQKRADYNRLAAQLLREALVQLKANKAIVRADAATQKILKDGALKELSNELNAELSIGDTLEEGSGVIVDASDGHLHFDNTLETRLRRLQSSLRSSVHQVLMGEKL
ncbi:MAG TPA: V-type ATP synthase subunit E family protein [Anaerolineales bacterium]|nr:V-type ATP synthase subunit E family protein [Anaerolineales bacterium]